MKIIDNPWKLMEDVAKKYSQLEGVKVYFVDDDFKEKSSACVQFWKNAPPHIYMKCYLKIQEIPEIMAHEMAHVIVGYPKAGEEYHSNEWVDAFAQLLKEMNEWRNKFQEEIKIPDELMEVCRGELGDLTNT
jgi:hypothetical protein